MKNIELTKEFINLLDKCEKEEVYQEFLEKHTELLPTETFKLNHGIHLSLVFSKLPIGNSYISDFCFISKSSAEWNIVFIELEKPNARFFNKDGTQSIDFNKGYSQILDWKRYFSSAENQLAFKQIPAIKTIMSTNPKMYYNPCNYKYILVLGRRENLQASNFYEKRRELCTNDIYIMTYDSLYENLAQKTKKYNCRIKDNYLYIDSEHFVDESVFAWTDCTNIKIKQILLKTLENNRKKHPMLPKVPLSDYLGENTDKKLEILRSNIINKIEA